MKNKRGFTLIEIIICIGLIALIGTVSVVTFNKVNGDKDDVTERVISAANVFANVEKDSEGITYINGIYNGRKALQIPLRNLVDKGYISEEDSNKIYDTYKDEKLLNENEDYYILLLDGSAEGVATKEYCQNNEVAYIASWQISSSQPVYLCDKKNNFDYQDNIISQYEQSKIVANLDKYAVSEEYYNSITDSDKDSYLTKDENGLFHYYNEETKNLFYYYRGAVDNNYIKLGKDKDGKDLYWRILWFSNNNMKLVLDDTVPIDYVINGKSLEVKSGDIIREFYLDSYHNEKYYVLNPIYEKDEIKSKKYIIYRNIKYSDILDGMIEFDFENSDVKNSFYFEQIKNWFGKTNLDQLEMLTSGKLCYNYYYKASGSGSTWTFEPSDNFECIDKDKEYNKSFYAGKVGFLTYGDVVRAGVSVNPERKIDKVSSGNYLFSNDDNIILIDKSEDNKIGATIKYGSYLIENSLISATYYNYSKSNTCDGTYSYNYKIDGKEGNTLMDWTCVDRITTNTIVADSVKPTIILDMTNYKLSNNSGTKQDSYEIIKK